MSVRLAFSVAAHLEPEILVVDEVLAVGDSEFQKKSLGKMRDVASGGRTVLFVSHQLGMVSSICHSGILLDQGRIQMQGPVNEVIDRYQKQRKTSNSSLDRRKSATKSGLAVVSAVTRSTAGEDCDQFGHEEPIFFCFGIEQTMPVSGELFLSVALLDHLGRRVFTDEYPLRRYLKSEPGEAHFFEANATLPMPLLVGGEYSLVVTINSYEGRIYDRLDGVADFTVVDRGSRLAKYEGWDIGPIMPPLVWGNDGLPTG
jgi:lipopolysaccharide transport system ATP-binding protein